MDSIGFDIVTISRIKQWMKDAPMLEKVFTDNERGYCLNHRHPHKQLAAAFAVKEAFMKAIGTGWSNGVQWKDVESFNKGGVVSIQLYNKAKEICGMRKVFISTSCAGDLAIALVVVSDGI